MSHVVVAKQSSRESCVNDVIRCEGHYRRTRASLRQWLTVEAAAVKKNMHFCSVRWVYCGQINDEEEKEKLKKRKRLWVRVSIARRQQFGAFHALVKDIKVEDPRTFPNFVRMDAQQFQYLLRR